LKSATTYVTVFFATLAAFLLAATLAWHIPFMLWDHLELAPMYQGWMAGHLDQTTFWKLQGTGHWHVATYLLLLPSAWVTHGDPWLDCILSWMFLLAYGGLLLRWRARTVPLDRPVDLMVALLMVFLVLYPGNFFNLQMGWQLAVFQCLFGAAVSITALSAPRLTWPLNLVALVGAALGVLSFAVSYALFVVAVAMIFLRLEMSWPRRILHVLPWFLLALGVYHFGHAAQGVLVHFHTIKIVDYSLYYLGSGVARFAPLLAPWLGAAALVLLACIVAGIRNRQAAMPWFGLALFALVGAALTAVGRGFLGDASGALVPRYISFSIAFWIGLLGLLARARADGARWHVARWTTLIGLLALVNAGQLTWQARLLGRDSRSIERTICHAWPNLDKSFLDGLIYSGADAARGYLQDLHDLGFAPFDSCTANVVATP
jgi:hypothetical protein